MKFLIHQVREVNKYQWKKANSALCRYLSLTIPVAGCRRLSWLKNQFRRHAATDIWVKGKLSLALMGNGNHYVHGSLSELCNYQIYYKFDNYTKFQFSLLLILYCIVWTCRQLTTCCEIVFFGGKHPSATFTCPSQSIKTTEKRKYTKLFLRHFTGPYFTAIQLLDPAMNPTDSGGNFKIYLLSVLCYLQYTKDAKALWMLAQ